MNTLAYKPTLDQVLPRLRSLYERHATDRVFASMQTPSRAIAEFAAQYPEGFCDYPEPEQRVRFWDSFLKERADVEDDSVPSLYLSEFDQGLYGGVLGGRVQFMAHPDSGWISSMVAPLLRDWSEFDRLGFDPAHPWFQRYQHQMGVFCRAAKGKFGISHFILIDGLNFIFELIGATDTYVSLNERPEMVRRAVDFAFDLNVRIQKTFFDTVPALQFGTCSNMVQWIPGRIVSESVDPFHMTSVAYFERWGREPVERILGQFDGGVVHLHGNGRHLLEAVCTIPRLKAIFLGDDRGFPAAIDVLNDLRTRAGDMPLVLQVDYPVFCQRLGAGSLSGGVFYKVRNAPNAPSANRLMERVREYRVG